MIYGRNFKRSIGLFLALVYTGTNVVFASSYQSNLWAERKKSFEIPLVPIATFPKQKLPSIVSSGVRLSSLLRHLSQANGTIRKISKPANANGQVVVHIQDIHQNDEAQANIQQSVQDLINSGNVSVVALEGAFAPIEIKKFRLFPDQQSVRDVVDYLKEKNRITGPMVTAFLSQKEVPGFVGIDDRAHYNANVAAYKKSISEKPVALKALEKEVSRLVKMKAESFNENLLAFDASMSAYHAGRSTMGEYVTRLETVVSDVSTQTELFLAALHLEKTLNFERVEMERGALLTQLTGKLSKKALSQLMETSLAYRLGRVGHAEFYGYLRDLCSKNGLSLTKFPSMDMYLQYLSHSNAIDSEKLTQELASLEHTAYAALAKTDMEKELIAESRRVILQKKLLDYALSPEEWREYKAVIERSPQRPKQSDEIASSYTALLAMTKSFARFYVEAEARDRAMAANTLKQLRGKNAAAILVTGGFHAPGLDRCLNEAGITVVTFTPKVTRVEANGESRYLSFFAQEKTPLEKLFEGSKLSVSPPPAPAQGEMALMVGAQHALRSPDAASAFRSSVAELAPGSTPVPTDITSQGHELRSSIGGVQATFDFSLSGKLHEVQSVPLSRSPHVFLIFPILVGLVGIIGLIVLVSPYITVPPFRFRLSPLWIVALGALVMVVPVLKAFPSDSTLPPQKTFDELINRINQWLDRSGFPKKIDDQDEFVRRLAPVVQHWYDENRSKIEAHRDEFPGLIYSDPSERFRIVCRSFSGRTPIVDDTNTVGLMIPLQFGMYEEIFTEGAEKADAVELIPQGSHPLTFHRVQVLRDGRRLTHSVVGTGRMIEIHFEPKSTPLPTEYRPLSGPEIIDRGLDSSKRWYRGIVQPIPDRIVRGMQSNLRSAKRYFVQALKEKQRTGHWAHPDVPRIFVNTILLRTAVLRGLNRPTAIHNLIWDVAQIQPLSIPIDWVSFHQLWEQVLKRLPSDEIRSTWSKYTIAEQLEIILADSKFRAAWRKLLLRPVSTTSAGRFAVEDRILKEMLDAAGIHNPVVLDRGASTRITSHDLQVALNGKVIAVDQQDAPLTYLNPYLLAKGQTAVAPTPDNPQVEFRKADITTTYFPDLEGFVHLVRDGGIRQYLTPEHVRKVVADVFEYAKYAYSGIHYHTTHGTVTRQTLFSQFVYEIGTEDHRDWKLVHVGALYPMGGRDRSLFFDDEGVAQAEKKLSQIVLDVRSRLLLQAESLAEGQDAYDEYGRVLPEIREKVLTSLFGPKSDEVHNTLQRSISEDLMLISPWTTEKELHGGIYEDNNVVVPYELAYEFVKEPRDLGQLLFDIRDRLPTRKAVEWSFASIPAAIRAILYAIHKEDWIDRFLLVKNQKEFRRITRDILNEISVYYTKNPVPMWVLHLLLILSMQTPALKAERPLIKIINSLDNASNTHLAYLMGRLTAFFGGVHGMPMTLGGFHWARLTSSAGYEKVRDHILKGGRPYGENKIQADSSMPSSLADNNLIAKFKDGEVVDWNKWEVAPTLVENGMAPPIIANKTDARIAVDGGQGYEVLDETLLPTDETPIRPDLLSENYPILEDVDPWAFVSPLHAMKAVLLMVAPHRTDLLSQLDFAEPYQENFPKAVQATLAEVTQYFTHHPIPLWAFFAIVYWSSTGEERNKINAKQALRIIFRSLAIEEKTKIIGFLTDNLPLGHSIPGFLWLAPTEIPRDAFLFQLLDDFHSPDATNRIDYETALPDSIGKTSLVARFQDGSLVHWGSWMFVETNQLQHMKDRGLRATRNDQTNLFEIKRLGSPPSLNSHTGKHYIRDAFTEFPLFMPGTLLFLVVNGVLMVFGFEMMPTNVFLLLCFSFFDVALFGWTSKWFVKWHGKAAFRAALEVAHRQGWELGKAEYRWRLETDFKALFTKTLAAYIGLVILLAFGSFVGISWNEWFRGGVAFAVAATVNLYLHIRKNVKFFGADYDPQIIKLGDAILAARTSLTARNAAKIYESVINDVLNLRVGELYESAGKDGPRAPNLVALTQYLETQIGKQVNHGTLTLEEAQCFAEHLTRWIGHPVHVDPQNALVVVARARDIESIQAMLRRLTRIVDVDILIDPRDIEIMRRSIVGRVGHRLHFFAYENLISEQGRISSELLQIHLQPLIRRKLHSNWTLIFSRGMTLDSIELGILSAEELRSITYAALEDCLTQVTIQGLPLESLLYLARVLSSNA